MVNPDVSYNDDLTDWFAKWNESNADEPVTLADLVDAAPRVRVSILEEMDGASNR